MDDFRDKVLDESFDMRIISIRHELEQAIKQAGVTGLMIRIDKRSRCRCLNVMTKDGNDKCLYCGGTGKLSFIEKVSFIYDNFFRPQQALQTKAGYHEKNLVCFYMTHKDMPSVRDRILICGFDSKGLPVDIKEEYVITSIEDYRCNNGRLEYYKVYATTAPEKRNLDSKRLNKISLKLKSEIMKGKRISWQTDK